MKRAIVLSGGGARGSYEVGVWKALAEMGQEFDIVTGSSVGSLNGAIMAQGELDTAYELWESLDTSHVLDFEVEEQIDTVEGMLETLNQFAKEAFRSHGISSAPLIRLLREKINEEKIRAAKMRFGLVTFEVPAMKHHHLYIDEIPKGKLVDYLVASSSCFPAMQSHEFDGRMFIDGGYTDNIPVRLAVRGGAQEAVVVNLRAIGIVQKSYFKQVKMDLIEPRWDLGAMLVFDSNRARRNITLGYQDCMKHFGRLDGGKYTFFKGEAKQNAPRIYAFIKSLFARLSIDVEGKIDRQMPNNLDSVNEYLAKYAVMRAVKKHWDKKVITDVDFVTAAAEAAGEILEVTPMETYKFETFNLRVMNRIVRVVRLPYSELDFDISPALSVKECIANITGAVTPIPPINRMMYIVSCLSDYEKLVTNKRLIAMLAFSMPTEFLAALYILALGSFISTQNG